MLSMRIWADLFLGAPYQALPITATSHERCLTEQRIDAYEMIEVLDSVIGKLPSEQDIQDKSEGDILWLYGPRGVCQHLNLRSLC
jgi:hypothetical protein